jgi:branched-chain amino acid transport system substrate-binding protein
MRTTSLRLVGSLALVALTGTACGSRLPHDEVLSAARPVVNVGSGAADPGTAPTEGAVADAAPLTSGTDSGAAPSSPSDLAAKAATSVASRAGAGPGSAALSGGRAGTGAATANGAAGAAGRPVTGGTASGAVPSASSAAVDPAAKAAGAPVAIGHIGTYSGVIGSLQAGGTRMAQIWAQSVNARGGLGGHPVRLVTADDGGDPARYLSITKDMVENQGVVAFVGNMAPLSINGGVKYLEEKKIPVVGGDLTNLAWFESPMLFAHGTWIIHTFWGAIRMAVQKGNTRVGLLYCAEAEICTKGQQYFDEGVKRVGGQPVYKAQVSLAQPDFTAECLQAKNANVQAFIMGADDSTISRVMKSCAQQGYHPQYASFAIAVTSRLQSDPNAEGFLAPQSTFPWMTDDTPAAQEYQQAIKSSGGTLTTSSTTSLVWTAGKLLEAASTHLGSSPTPAEFLTGLYGLRDERLGGLSYPLHFEAGKAPVKQECYFAIQVKDGKWVAPEGSKLQCF